MKIAFYAPFKPLDHGTPSGDLVIAKGLFDFLKRQGHEINIPSRVRGRWIYYKPWLWPGLILDFLRSIGIPARLRPDLWFTYHSYYKAPDILGPFVCRALGIKYVIFQGIYSTKRKKRLKTMPGFFLNRFALLQADHVITNKMEDFKNLKRLIPEKKLSYIPPGIYPQDFERQEDKGRGLRVEWQLPKVPVILTAAMFRNDVKTQGLAWLIQCCSALVKNNVPFFLVIAGSGPRERELKILAEKSIPGHYRFVGKIPRHGMYKFYSAGDIFAFPGIRESLGMVFLEAQSCGLPVVAFDNGGIPEVVDRGKTGLLVPMFQRNCFANVLIQLIEDADLRSGMGQRAAAYIRKHHDLDQNYPALETILHKIAFKNQG